MVEKIVTTDPPVLSLQATTRRSIPRQNRGRQVRVTIRGTLVTQVTSRQLRAATKEGTHPKGGYPKGGRGGGHSGGKGGKGKGYKY